VALAHYQKAISIFESLFSRFPDRSDPKRRAADHVGEATYAHQSHRHAEAQHPSGSFDGHDGHDDPHPEID